ncbi:two-component system chemotaxis response regulator CheB [Georgenia soli]|uniref:protein-glutamate methylesterase n=1 Tax=Georgenia soli TaxID=638953 RepID=A0A2A9ELI2_9MICO|nr:chemotaxis protein CheB [Georgenia soli]PFG39079.1 two-component system chemotaxis response regulator CheB [Georgenia soli]
MARRDVVVVGASAGGVEALRQLAGGLPADFPATVVVVLHVPSTGTSALPRILDRAGPLPARHAVEGDRLRHGQILVAAPDQHLIVYDDAVTLSRGPRENGHRPAVDVLFRSAAAALGPRVVAVVLSGALDDGAAGMVAVKSRGGVGICQDPGEALHESMPSAAMQAVEVDRVVPAAMIPALLSRIVLEEVTDVPTPPPDRMRNEALVAEFDLEAIDNGGDRPGMPSDYTCPDCQGPLYEIVESGLLRFRCRVGHAWSVASLAAQQTATLQGALWMALRSLEEKATLTRRLGQQAVSQGRPLTSEALGAETDDVLRAAATLRDLIDQITAHGTVTGQEGGSRREREN